MLIPSLVERSLGNLLDDRIRAAEQRVRDYCGWHVAPVITERMTLDGSGGRSLFIPSLKVSEINSCSILGETVDLSTLEWSGDGFLRRPGGWPDRLRAVTITVTHGFESVPIMSEIINEMASRSMSAAGGRTREAAGGVSVSNAQVAPGVSGGVVLMDHEKQAIDRYRIFGRP